MKTEKNKKRIFLMDWDNTRPAFIMAAEELNRRGYEIVYWVVPDIKAAAAMKSRFEETLFHSHDDAIKIKACAEVDENKFAPPGEDLIRNFFEIESIIACMKKFYKLSPSALAKKDMFHKLIRYWYGLLTSLKPDIIFFANMPHSVYDYTVFFIAKFLKIKTFMFVYAGMGDRYITIEDFKLTSPALLREYDKNKSGHYKLEDLSPEVREFYQWHQNFKTGAVRPDLADFLKKSQGLNKLLIRLKTLFKSLADFSIFSKIVYFIIKELGPNIKKEYNSLTVAPDFNKKYVYLALAYQPEGSTSPLGGIFVDQILIAKTLSYCLPPDWLIYIKEHPTQWSQGNLAYFDFRYEGYYKEMAKIKNTRLIPMETNSHELIANAQAVSTVSGTSGIEAILRLKPVLLFGNMWYYQDCPGVFKIKNAAVCQEALNKIAAGFSISEQDIINYLYSLDKISYHFNYERCAADCSKLTEEEAGENIIKNMINYAEANL